MPRLSRTTWLTVLTSRPARITYAVIGGLGAGIFLVISRAADVTELFGDRQTQVADKPSHINQVAKPEASTVPPVVVAERLPVTSQRGWAVPPAQKEGGSVEASQAVKKSDPSDQEPDGLSIPRGTITAEISPAGGVTSSGDEQVSPPKDMVAAVAGSRLGAASALPQATDAAVGRAMGTSRAPAIAPKRCLTKEQLDKILELLKEGKLEGKQAVDLSSSLECRYSQRQMDGALVGAMVGAAIGQIGPETRTDGSVIAGAISGFSEARWSSPMKNFRSAVERLAMSPDPQVRRNLARAIKSDFGVRDLRGLRDAVARGLPVAAAPSTTTPQTEANDAIVIWTLLHRWGWAPRVEKPTPASPR